MSPPKSAASTRRRSEEGALDIRQIVVLKEAIATTGAGPTLRYAKDDVPDGARALDGSDSGSARRPRRLPRRCLAWNAIVAARLLLSTNAAARSRSITRAAVPSRMRAAVLSARAASTH